MTTQKRAWIWLLALGIICTSGVFLLRTSAQSTQPEDIPLIRLVVSPETYQGKRVRLIGFVRLEFEGNAIYLHKEDYEHAIYGNGVWLTVPATMSLQDRKSRNMKYCIIEGTFDAKMNGHMGLWSGEINNISRFDVRSDPAKPRR